VTANGQVDGWLTLAEAAERLNLSVHQVRRQARAGRLVSRRVETDRGPSWRICLDDGCQDDATVAPDDGQGDEPSRQGDATVTGHAEVAVGELVDLVRDLQTQLTQAVAAAAMWQERARMLSDQFALAAPQQPPEAPGEPAASVPTMASSRWRSLGAWITPGVVVVLVILVAAQVLLAALPSWSW